MHRDFFRKLAQNPGYMLKLLNIFKHIVTIEEILFILHVVNGNYKIIHKVYKV